MCCGDNIKDDHKALPEDNAFRVDRHEETDTTIHHDKVEEVHHEGKTEVHHDSRKVKNDHHEVTKVKNVHHEVKQ